MGMRLTSLICTSVGQEHVLDHPSFLISVVIWSLVIKVIKDFQFSLGGGNTLYKYINCN